MGSLPNYRPRQLSLGPLETEILEIIWNLGSVTVKDVHEQILANPNRELAYASVTTVLNRLTKKGWLACDRQGRSYTWNALISKSQAKALQAYEQLNQFLAVGNPDVVAAFADRLDQDSVEQIQAIAAKIQTVRATREKQEPCI